MLVYCSLTGEGVSGDVVMTSKWVVQLSDDLEATLELLSAEFYRLSLFFHLLLNVVILDDFSLSFLGIYNIF